MGTAAVQVQYRDEFVTGFAQRSSILRSTTTKEMITKGNQAVFLIANTTNAAVTRGINGLIPAHDTNNSQVTATLVEKHDLSRMTNFNIFQSQSDQRAIMQMNSMAAINNDADAIVLAELANGTLDTGAAAVASMTMISKAIAQLQANGVPWDGNVWAVVSPAFMEYMSTLANFSSRDYVELKPLDGMNYPGMNLTATNGVIRVLEWKGVKWFTHSKISGITTNAEKCFMYHATAIGYAANTEEVKVPIGFNEEQDYSWARCSLYHGAKMLQNSGIVQMLHDGSALVAT